MPYRITHAIKFWFQFLFILPPLLIGPAYRYLQLEAPDATPETAPPIVSTPPPASMSMSTVYITPPTVTHYRPVTVTVLKRAYGPTSYVENVYAALTKTNLLFPDGFSFPWHLFRIDEHFKRIWNKMNLINLLFRSIDVICCTCLLWVIYRFIMKKPLIPVMFNNIPHDSQSNASGNLQDNDPSNDPSNDPNDSSSNDPNNLPGNDPNNLPGNDLNNPPSYDPNYDPNFDPRNYPNDFPDFPNYDPNNYPHNDPNYVPNNAIDYVPPYEPNDESNDTSTPPAPYDELAFKPHESENTNTIITRKDQRDPLDIETPRETSIRRKTNQLNTNLDQVDRSLHKLNKSLNKVLKKRKELSYVASSARTNRSSPRQSISPSNDDASAQDTESLSNAGLDQSTPSLNTNTETLTAPENNDSIHPTLSRPEKKEKIYSERASIPTTKNRRELTFYDVLEINRVHFKTRGDSSSSKPIVDTSSPSTKPIADASSSSSKPIVDTSSSYSKPVADASSSSSTKEDQSKQAASTVDGFFQQLQAKGTKPIGSQETKRSGKQPDRTPAWGIELPKRRIDRSIQEQQVLETIEEENEDGQSRGPSSPVADFKKSEQVSSQPSTSTVPLRSVPAENKGGRRKNKGKKNRRR